MCMYMYVFYRLLYIYTDNYVILKLIRSGSVSTHGYGFYVNSNDPAEKRRAKVLIVCV